MSLQRSTRMVNSHCPLQFGLTVILLVIVQAIVSDQQYLSDTLLTNIKTDPFYIDLYHKLDSDKEFKQRGSILVRPRTEHRPSQATFVHHYELDSEELKKFKQAYEKDENYYLKSVYRLKKQQAGEEQPIKTTQTVVKFCSLFVTNLTDTLSINLSPTNEFISVNLFTSEPECSIAPTATELSTTKFTTTLSIDPGSIGPQPDTVTYIKRLEEERQNKLKEGKEDNRSFFAKYWIYIVPAVIILMMMSGPEAQGAR